MRKVTPWFLAGVVTFTLGLAAYLLISKSRPRFAETSSRSAETISTDNSKNIDSRWVYINQDLRWESPPKEVISESGDYQYTDNARLLIFFPDGQFASISSLIYQSGASRKLQLIPNSGFGVYRGTWKLNEDGKLTITSRLVSSNKMSVADIVEGHKTRVERLTISEFAADRLAGQLELNGRKFIPGPYIEGILELLRMPEGDI
jgi:hypothetical protein